MKRNLKGENSLTNGSFSSITAGKQLMRILIFFILQEIFFIHSIKRIV
jgi:hypothetical protein